MTGIYMFDLFNFFTNKEIMKVLKNIINRASDVLKRNQQYLMRKLHDPLPCYSAVIVVLTHSVGVVLSVLVTLPFSSTTG